MIAIPARFWGGPMDGMTRVVDDFDELKFPVMAGPVEFACPDDDHPHTVPYIVETYERVGTDRRTGERVYKYKPQRRRK